MQTEPQLRSKRAFRRAAAAGLAGLAIAGTLAVSAFGSTRPARTASLAVSLNERASLHKTGSHELTLNEQGSASGTIRGTIYIHLHVESNRVSAEVNIYPSGGSLAGYASASYRVEGAYASFSGTMSITSGSGRYAHAHARGLRFSGSIKRINDATTVAVSGKLYL